MRYLVAARKCDSIESNTTVLMGDLYFDNIEDQKTYTDEMILRDVRAMVAAGDREGPLLDYKADLSEKENWPETMAAFANSFGGLIIFGVESKDDQPRQLTGFDPGGVEIKTKLANMLLSRIRPRPDFAVRVVTFDQDPTKEVALVRVLEGQRPPYMHSKGDAHRIYLRVSARKTEADYLQLASLLEKRSRFESQTVASAEELFGSGSQLQVTKPGTNQISQESYRFVLSPMNMGAGPRLNLETEHLFIRCMNDVLGRSPSTGILVRTQKTTIFRKRGDDSTEQRFGLAVKGGLGFISPCVAVQDGVHFIPVYFCRQLLEFLSVSALFYEKASRFYGTCILDVNVQIPEAKLVPGLPTSTSPLQGADLFSPPLNLIRANGGTQVEVALSPMASDHLQDYVEAVLIDIVRSSGSVLGERFRAATKPLFDDAVARLARARRSAACAESASE